MTIRSMTGFAQVKGQVNGQLGFTLSLKSVNHRFLDVHFRLPSDSDDLEMKLRRRLKEKLARGHVELTLNIERAVSEDFSLNRQLVGGYLAAYRAAAQEFGLADPPDLNVILRMPGALESAALPADGEMDTAVLSRLEGVGDGVLPFSFVDGALAHGHAGGAKRRNLVELGALRNGELEISLLLEEGGRRIRVILNGIFLADHQLVSVGLEHQEAQWHFDGFRIGGRLIHGDVDGGCPRHERLVKEHATIHGADQHGALADGRKIKVVAAVRVGFGVGHDLHASLQLDEQHIHAGGDFVAVRAVVDDACNRSGVRGGCGEQ